MNDTIMRVRYYDDQFLSKAEFVDEQAYHVALRRRHQTANHTWGIVYGLEIEKTEGENANYTVNPGMAIDGYGRMLILPTPRISPFVESSSSRWTTSAISRS